MSQYLLLLTALTIMCISPGQFWNVPIDVQTYEYVGPTPTYLDVDSLFAVCVSPPGRNGEPSRPRKLMWQSTIH